VRELRELIDSTGSHARIEVDGGVNAETAPLLAAAGADIMVAGSYVFKAKDPEAAIHSLAVL
ncbi:MAG: ribulose-phosphate 3-epimerase, partial [Bacteroidales bacterium]|nr:ribulose-phosphate 3-epimerase [Bacteroidales bacterium]